VIFAFRVGEICNPTINRSSIKIISVLSLAWLLSACQSICHYTAKPTKLTVEVIKTYSCPALPPTFKEADLIGTWVPSYSLNDKDTLIIEENGTYKQIYNDPDAGQRYEGNWQEWWIEYRESDYLRLHLKGMRRAGEIDSIFNREGGGIDPDLFTTIDYCENDVVEMPDGIVLIVTGVKDNTPRDIVLRQTRLAGSEWTWSFQLQEEKEIP
jgi:hypothetical protein